MMHIILIHPPTMPLTLISPVRERKRATGACKGQNGANQQAGGGVRKVSQYCRLAEGWESAW